MTVKELFRHMLGKEIDLQEEISNEEAVSCSAAPTFLEMADFTPVELPKMTGFVITISTEKREIKAKFEFDKISELSIKDVKP
jgi:hypothetical protein